MRLRPRCGCAPFQTCSASMHTRTHISESVQLWNTCSLAPVQLHCYPDGAALDLAAPKGGRNVDHVAVQRAGLDVPVADSKPSLHSLLAHTSASRRCIGCVRSAQSCIDATAYPRMPRVPRIGSGISTPLWSATRGFDIQSAVLGASTRRGAERSTPDDDLIMDGGSSFVSPLPRG